MSEEGRCKEKYFYLFPASHIYVNHYNEKLVSFQRDCLKPLWLVLVAQARKRSVMSSEAHCWMCFYGKLPAYRQCLKSESLTADLCAGKAYVCRSCVHTRAPCQTGTPYSCQHSTT